MDPRLHFVCPKLSSSISLVNKFKLSGFSHFLVGQPSTKSLKVKP